VIYLFEAAATFWDSPAMVAAVREAFEACRRIEKELEPGREVARLGMALRTIEQALCAQYPSPSVLEGTAADTAIAALPLVGSVRLPFNVQSTNGVLKPRSFVTTVPFSKESFASVSTTLASNGDKAGTVSVAADTDLCHSREQRSKLVRRIEMARRGNAGVALGSSRHIDLTKALRRFLHATDAQEPFKINLIYKDGSMGGDVRLRQLPKREEDERPVELCAALESCRHFDLDTAVDFCLLRNADVARREDATFSVQEGIAYTRIRTSLEDLCGNEGLHLRLFHTGLEPAVMGFYRAVIDLLLAGRQLKVTPVFFVGGPDEDPWF
jgi:hypothetical protein